jgi:hypothetical protein
MGIYLYLHIDLFYPGIYILYEGNGDYYYYYSTQLISDIYLPMGFSQLPSTQGFPVLPLPSLRGPEVTPDECPAETPRSQVPEFAGNGGPARSKRSST